MPTDTNHCPYRHNCNLALEQLESEREALADQVAKLQADLEGREIIIKALTDRLTRAEARTSTSSKSRFSRLDPAESSRWMQYYGRRR